MICDAMSGSRFPFTGKGVQVARFSALYRAACTDLSMAEQYQLPPATVEYLHRLVGRAHSQLYRTQRLPLSRWIDYITSVIPHAVFRDPCVAIAAIVFFGTFTLSALIAMAEGSFPNYPQQVLGGDQISALEKMYEEPVFESGGRLSLAASGGYIKHNAGIGLQCFALGPLLLPCLCILGYNGTVLGASFGYMARPDVASGDNFMHFVTAHGAFELTAIALAAAAGLRVGIGLFSTGGLSRFSSFRLNAERSIPIIVCSVTLFVFAAFTEGCLSPSGAPYLVKAIFAVVSSASLVFYFVMLGIPTPERLDSLENNPDNPWRVRRSAT